jgi:hypothetical protein
MSTQNHNIWYFRYICRHLIAKHGHLAVESSKWPRLERIFRLRTAPKPVQMALSGHPAAQFPA